MANNPAVEQAVEKALSEALGTIERQLGEAKSSFEAVQAAIQEGGNQDVSARFISLLPSLIRLQAAEAALSASIGTVIRFVGGSAQWTGLVTVAPSAGVAAPAPASPPAAVEEAPAAEPEAEAPPAEEVAAEEVAAAVGSSAPVEEEAPAVEEAAPAEEAAAAPVAVDVESLPDDLKKLHQKAQRFARVTVQELFMYKKEEVDKGRENRDLYNRFKEEIDKSKALYDKRFEKIAEHNVDYLYDELVRVLAENDAGALGNYPYSTPSSGS